MSRARHNWYYHRFLVKSTYKMFASINGYEFNSDMVELAWGHVYRKLLAEGFTMQQIYNARGKGKLRIISIGTIKYPDEKKEG